MKPIELDGHSVFFPAYLEEISSLFDLSVYSSVVVFCDENSRAYCLPSLITSLPKLKDALILEIPSGEMYKKIYTCEKVWQALFDKGIDRSALMINLGGGVVTDMGGFIAATYKRGIDFVNVPTTFLSQVDATMGGKTGIDFGDIKNGIGLFAFPKAIFVHTPFLNTLNEAQLLSGYAEMLKHALISSEKNWDAISAIDPLANPDWNKLIRNSLLIKKKIVEQDPYESGIRKALNFGHTIGHALEGFSLSINSSDKENGQNTALLHGHAVALGMVAELWLSTQKTGFPKKDVQKISKVLLNLYRSYYNIDSNTEKLITLMANDKKNKTGQINFVLLKKTGQPVLDVACNKKEITEALNHLEENL